MGLALLANNVAPLIVRNGVALATALFAYPITSAAMPDVLPNALGWLFIIPKELLLGYGIGFMFSVIIWAFENAGSLIDIQSGLNNAAMMDPTSNSDVAPSGMLAKQYAIALFVMTGMLEQLSVALVQSFVIWPWNQWSPQIQVSPMNLFIWRSDTLWQLSLQIAAPVLLVLVCLEFGLGLINRVTPQFDVFNIGMSLKVLAAMLVMSIAAIFWAETALSFFAKDLDLARLFLKAK
jgi:type III secretion protein T